MDGLIYTIFNTNTDRSDKKGTHWWSILDTDGKKDFFLFDLGIKGLKNYIIKDDETIIKKVLKGVENLKEDKSRINLVIVNLLKNNNNKLSEGEKNALSETATDFLHFIESFAEHENQNLIHLWLLENLIQNINANTCRLF